MNNSKHKNTGANKVIILGVVSNVKESDFNLRVIFEKAKINSIAHSLIAGDLKVYNILLAMSNNASKYPCGFCKSKRFEGIWLKGAALRTLEDNARLGLNQDPWKRKFVVSIQLQIFH